ncbi:hypothetical protein M9H77_34840 [Catharanthus roseus]|uniref:Uncharacterized protein n=1 Tax=Catharanthus roseus TaxID=4058 RepID=A0ACB9ZQZ1_CATRO|nr:hypothetical protein M9H77_34840 [Catharanthus roseus]
MKFSKGFQKFIEKHKPYVIMIFIQFVYAGMSLFSKAAITEGMNPYIFVVYRQAFATLALAPFAFFLERRNPARLSFVLLCKIFLVSLFGITLSLNLFYFGLNYVTATFATAFTNTIPAITFILAALLRIEKISIQEKHGIAKVLGSTIGLSGALIFTFLKGPAIFPSMEHNYNNTSSSHHLAKTYSKQDWLKGSFIMLLANLTWSLWLIMQGIIIKQYPSKLRLTTLQIFFCCILSAIWALTRERSIESWKLGWNINLLSVLYCVCFFLLWRAYVDNVTSFHT